MCGDPLQAEKLAKKAEKDALEAAEASEIAKIKTVFFFLPSSAYSVCLSAPFSVLAGEAISWR